MGNYSLVANSTFKAKDFDEMIKPYMMYTADYNAQEEALSELATKADIWQGLANEQTDPVAYAQYTNYANALKDQAAIIASGGLNPTSRQTLLNLKRRYASEITPIETAYNTRKAQVEEQRKALLQNPTLLLSRRADTTSLDDYMKNPNLGYDAYSGALLTQQVGQAAANIAKELRNYGKGIALDGFTKTWLQKHGYSASEVAFAINHPDDPRASEVLNTIVNNVMSDSGIANWADNNTLNQAYNYARQGLWNAVGQTQVGTYIDEAAKRAAIRKEEEEEVIRKEKEESKKRVRPSSLYTRSEIDNYSTMENKVRDWIKAGYLRKNLESGDIELMPKGLAYANKTTMTTRDHQSTLSWANPDFRDFLKTVGAVNDKEVTLGNNTPGANGTYKDYTLTGWRPSLMNKYIEKISLGYDATRDTEFIYDYDTDADKARAKDMIRRALGNSDPEVVTYKGPEIGYDIDDKLSLTKEQFNSNDIEVLASKGSKWGQVFQLDDKGTGKSYIIRVPDVDRAQQESVQRYYIAADNTYKNMHKLKPQYDSIMKKLDTGIPLTEKEIEFVANYDADDENYGDLLWKGQKAQGNITTGFKTTAISTN